MKVGTEIELTGGRTTAGVVRIGDTVHRPISARSSFVHGILRHLEAKGFHGAPRFLGVDDKGREVLTFLPGDVPDEPRSARGGPARQSGAPRCKPLQSVAGGRFELYSVHPIRLLAVPASVGAAK